MQLVRGAFRAARRALGIDSAKKDARAVAARLRSLKRGGVETLLLYGDKDEFLLENEDYFSCGRQDFAARFDMDTVILSGIDHQYYHAGQRQLIVDEILRRIRQDGLFSAIPAPGANPRAPDARGSMDAVTAP